MESLQAEEQEVVDVFKGKLPAEIYGAELFCILPAQFMIVGVRLNGDVTMRTGLITDFMEDEE